MRIGRHRLFDAGAALLLIAGLGAGSDFSANPMHVPETSAIRRSLLLPGDAYHGVEVQAKNGERWLGLLRTPAGYRTAMVTLRISAVHDVIVDGEKKRTGKSVGIVEPGDAVFLLKGFDHLVGRSSRTALDGRFALAPNSVSSLNFAGSQIEIQVLPSGRSEEFEPGKRVEVFQVNIKQGGKKASLPVAAAEGFNTVRLLWAGDLDGDGKIDFLFEDSGYNWGSARLFLSSAAKPGELVAEVGQFYRSGC